jgi:hypothetical protein
MGVWISQAESVSGSIYVLLRNTCRLFRESQSTAAPTTTFRLPLLRNPADKTEKSDSSQSSLNL